MWSTCLDATWGNWFHVLVVAPFLIYESYNPNPTLLMGVGVAVLLIHLGLVAWKCGWWGVSSTPCCGATSVPKVPSESSEAFTQRTPSYAWADFQRVGL